jgi:hypothetical protein
MRTILMLAVAAALCGCQTTPPPAKLVQLPATAPSAKPDRPQLGADDPETWALISKTLGLKGTFGRDAYTVTVPRDDLWVNTDLGEIPTEAGLETKFHFFKCPCGKTSLVGRFVVADYEANDVIEELQTDHQLKIAGMSPMFLREKPRVLTIFFQGTGEAEQLARILKGALSYTGDQRLPAIKVPE